MSPTSLKPAKSYGFAVRLRKFPLQNFRNFPLFLPAMLLNEFHHTWNRNTVCTAPNHRNLHSLKTILVLPLLNLTLYSHLGLAGLSSHQSGWGPLSLQLPVSMMNIITRLNMLYQCAHVRTGNLLIYTHYFVILSYSQAKVNP